jgi:Na+/melibiose symporter-like transporter
METSNRKKLFWFVLLLWIVLTLGTYILGYCNLWIFHDESSITYTTSGMTTAQVSDLYFYIDSFTDEDGFNKYGVPTFVPTSENKDLLEFDNNNNTYTIEYEIPDYQKYGIEIKSAQQSSSMMMGIAFLGALLLVVGGLFGILPMRIYAFEGCDWKDVWRS